MLTSKDVMDHHFKTTSFRRGYDERDVDDFLNEVIETLRYYEQGGRPGPLPTASPARPEPGGARPEPGGQASPAPPEPGGLTQRATRWLRGDPPS